MSDYENRILKIAESNNGYITNSIVKENKIPTVYLTNLSKKNRIERVERGIYVLRDYLEDRFYTYYLKYSKLAYTKRTALYLNNMSNRGIDFYEANFPRGYNTSRISEIKCYSPASVKYELGRKLIETPLGNFVMGYDHERCICDLFIYNFFDLEEIRFAIDYYKEQGINYDTLYSYAEKLNIIKEIRAVFEVT